MTVQTLIDVAAQAAAARQAQRTYGSLGGHQRTAVLRRLAELLGSRQDAILEANAADVADGDAAVRAGTMTPALAARLKEGI